MQLLTGGRARVLNPNTGDDKVELSDMRGAP